MNILKLLNLFSSQNNRDRRTVRRGYRDNNVRSKKKYGKALSRQISWYKQSGKNYWDYN